MNDDDDHVKNGRLVATACDGIIVEDVGLFIIGLTYINQSEC